MHTFINSPWQIGSLSLAHRLIQGPLAGYSCAPFRTLFSHFAAPAYSVSEMCSAIDVLGKHSPQSRYLYRAPSEQLLAYQIAGNDMPVLAEAALKLQSHGADLIDLNCGCPKAKIRKKGAGSALLDEPQKLAQIIRGIKTGLRIPLTVKIRIQGTANDLALAQQIEQAGADALIVHGRRWIDDYDIRCDYQQIGQIKQAISIPVIANGDINSFAQLQLAFEYSNCDGFMIGRAGSGRPWLYQELLEQRVIKPNKAQKITLFMTHLQGLSELEQEFKAILQSKSLVRYYFRNQLSPEQLNQFYQLSSLIHIEQFLYEQLPELSVKR